MAIRTKRNIENSTMYYLETQIDASWGASNIDVVLSFAQAEKSSKSVVCIELTDTTSKRKEIGSTTLQSEFTIVVNIFAKKDSVRLDLADFILEKLSDGYTYYEHSYDSVKAYVRTATGYTTLVRLLTDTRIEPFEGVNPKEQHRHTIVAVMRHNV